MNYRFGAYSLDTELVELTGPEGAVSVEPQVFALLAFLVENTDRVISKDEIIDAVWDRRIVSDANLNSRINAARRAVGDDGKAQDVIKTFPRRGFRFVAEVETGNEHQSTAAAAGGRSRVLVLPFRNQSSDPELDHFCEGLTEDLIAELSHVRQFTVATRAAAFALKDETVNVEALERERSVRYVIEGSVRRMGNKLRVSALLSDTEVAGVLWSDQYTRDDVDLFAVEEEISRRFAAALEPTMRRADRQRILDMAEPGAWEYYLRGWGRLHDEGIIGQEDLARRALEDFKKAIDLDPKLSEAYSGASNACWQVVGFNLTDDRDTISRDAIKYARKAVELNNFDAENVGHLGHTLVFAKQTEEGVHVLRHAVSMAPSDTHMKMFLGIGLIAGGHTEEGIRIQREVREAGRQHVGHGAASAWMALALVFEGQPEEAEPYAREAVANPHTQLWANISLILSLLDHGKTEEAIAEREALEAFKPGITVSGVAKLTPVTRPEFLKHMLDGLRAAGLTE